MLTDGVREELDVLLGVDRLLSPPRTRHAWLKEMTRASTPGAAFAP